MKLNSRNCKLQRMAIIFFLSLLCVIICYPSTVFAGNTSSSSNNNLIFETYDGIKVGKRIVTPFAEIEIKEVVKNDKLEYSDGKWR